MNTPLYETVPRNFYSLDGSEKIRLYKNRDNWARVPKSGEPFVFCVITFLRGLNVRIA